MHNEIIKSLDDLHIAGNVVLLRVDFNVPMRSGHIQDDARIKAHLPTIQQLLGKGAKLVLMTHIGRPKAGDENNPNFSTEVVGQHLAQLLGQPVQYSKTLTGPDVAFKVKSMKRGDILMLPNLRFDAGEESNDNAFAHRLASVGDIYVNDAFATAHRQHASTVAIATFFKERAMGLLMEQEIATLNYLMHTPDDPFVIIVGGSKIETKLPVMKNLVEKADHLLVGGAIANTLLVASGQKVGGSLVERSEVKAAEDILSWARRDKCTLHLPVDFVVADRLENHAYTKEVTLNDITEKDHIYDIGSRTLQQWKPILESARTVLWNGPVGAFEHPPFDTSTVALAKLVGHCSARTICGGGDTLSALKMAGVVNNINFISTGGGAMLEYLKGQGLPAIRALSYGKQNEKPSLSQKNFNRFLR